MKIRSVVVVLCVWAAVPARGFDGRTPATPAPTTRLSSHRLTALRQAVRVPQLASAYRTGQATQAGGPVAEPARVTVDALARPIATFVDDTPRGTSGVRRSDPYVQPAVWVDDRRPAAGNVVAGSGGEANPLRAGSAAAADGRSEFNPLR